LPRNYYFKFYLISAEAGPRRQRPKLELHISEDKIGFSFKHTSVPSRISFKHRFTPFPHLLQALTPITQIGVFFYCGRKNHSGLATEEGQRTDLDVLNYVFGLGFSSPASLSPPIYSNTKKGADWLIRANRLNAGRETRYDDALEITLSVFPAMQAGSLQNSNDYFRTVSSISTACPLNCVVLAKQLGIPMFKGLRRSSSAPLKLSFFQSF
jgi:hypothetical protein